MTGEWKDDDMERAFAEWRAGDARDAPLFSATYAAAMNAATKRPATAPWQRTAAAATILAVAAGGWLTLHERLPQVTTRFPEGGVPAPALSTWRSPTAFLLQGPSDMLTTTLPTISASFADLHALGVHAGHQRQQ